MAHWDIGSRKQPPNTGSFRHSVLGGETIGTIAFTELPDKGALL
jgi:hypothetical protein